MYQWAVLLTFHQWIMGYIKTSKEDSAAVHIGGRGHGNEGYIFQSPFSRNASHGGLGLDTSDHRRPDEPDAHLLPVFRIMEEEVSTSYYGML
ncbi:hypothetical protein BDR07DRAFT_1412855 [Suillus spraguei]|nr:hypothetical protein BDR07DRAFT_1412855 [Suillus spraguei]